MRSLAWHRAEQGFLTFGRSQRSEQTPCPVRRTGAASIQLSERSPRAEPRNPLTPGDFLSRNRKLCYAGSTLTSMGRRLPEWSRRIKELRTHCGLTQRSLSEKLGITKKIVADWEQGAQEPSPRRYVQLAKLADRELALWFLGRIGLDRHYLTQLLGRAKPGGSNGG